MLVAGVLKFDPLGRIRLSIAGEPIHDFNGGTPIDINGLLGTTPGGTPQVFNAAIGYENAEFICDSNNPLTPDDGPITDPGGAIRVSTDLPAYYYAGLPITADGFLSTDGGISPPPVTSGFNSGFSAGFGD